MNAVLEVYINSDPSKRNEEIIADVKRDRLVELLCCHKGIKRPIILFRLLRHYLVLKGFRYTSGRESQRIMYELVNRFFDA